MAKEEVHEPRGAEMKPPYDPPFKIPPAIWVIIWMCGQVWSEEQKREVFDWVCDGPLKHPKGNCYLELFVKLATKVVGDSDEARCLVHDTLVRLFSGRTRTGRRYLDSYDPSKYHGAQCPLLNWLATAVYHDAIRYKKWLDGDAYQLDDPFDDPPDGSSDAGEPQTKGDGGDSHARLFVKETLLGRERLITDLHLFEGFSFQEIAGRLGITENNARMIFFRAKKKLGDKWNS